MMTIESKTRLRTREKFGLRAWSLMLALIFSATGLALLLLPRVARDLAAAGLDSQVRYLLGAIHLAGGMSLLFPRLAAKAALPLGLFLAGVSLCLPPRPAAIESFIPAFLSIGVLLLAASWRLRDRADRAAWAERLLSYADRQDAARG